MANPLVLIRRLPRVARVLIVGSLVNKIGTFIVPYLTLVLCRDFRLSIRMVGLLVLGYGVGSLASTLSGGHLTDRLGRRLTLLISLLGSGVLAMALGCVTDARIFIPLLVLFGFLADLYRPASLAIIGDVLPSHQRAIGYAALRMAINLGFACGMALGGVLAHWSWRLLFVGDGLTTTLFGAIVWWAVPETRPAAEAGDVDKAHAPNGIALWRDRTFAALIFSAFVFKLVFYCAFTVLPLSITVWAGYSTVLYGVFVGINGLLVALFEVYLVDRLKHLRRLRVAAAGVLMSALGIACNGVLPLWPFFLASIVIWTIGEMLSVPQQMSFVADWAPVEGRGRYMSWFQATWSMAMAVNPLIMLPLYAWLGPQRFWTLLPLLVLPTVLVLLRLDRTADRKNLLRGLTTVV